MDGRPKTPQALIRRTPTVKENEYWKQRCAREEGAALRASHETEQAPELPWLEAASRRYNLGACGPTTSRLNFENEEQLPSSMRLLPYGSHDKAVDRASYRAAAPAAGSRGATPAGIITRGTLPVRPATSGAAVMPGSPVPLRTYSPAPAMTGKQPLFLPHEAELHASMHRMDLTSTLPAPTRYASAPRQAQAPAQAPAAAAAQQQPHLPPAAAPVAQQPAHGSSCIIPLSSAQSGPLGSPTYLYTRTVPSQVRASFPPAAPPKAGRLEGGAPSGRLMLKERLGNVAGELAQERFRTAALRSALRAATYKGLQCSSATVDCTAFPYHHY